MSDLFESKGFVADETFWERVRRVATSIEQEVHKSSTYDTDIDVPMTDESMMEVQVLHAPPTSPISPPLSPITPMYSPVTPPQIIFLVHPQTMVHNPDVSPIIPLEQTPLRIENDNLSGLVASETCDMNSAFVASAQSPAGRTQPRRSQRQSSHQAFNIHKDMALNPNSATTAAISALQQPSEAVAYSPILPPNVSQTPIASSSSSTAVAGRASRSKKHLPPVPTVPASFVTKAAKQPAFSAETGDLIDPVTSRPYLSLEIISPPGLHDDRHSSHGSQTRAYINTKVTPTLLEGMKIVAEGEPEKPLWWLGDFLMRKSAELETSESSPRSRS